MRIEPKLDERALDAAIAGGGPAGAALACRLAYAGRRVLVIERDPVPTHKVCGEFIGGDGLAQLAALDIDVAAFGAVPITRLRLLRGRREAEVVLPFRAAGLSRRALDAALLAKAEARGAIVLRGRRVGAISNNAVLVGANWLAAPAVFLATGKHDLRDSRRPETRAARGMVGFKLHLTPAPGQARALAGGIELALFADTYAGLQMIEGARANLCLVTTEARLRGAGGWEGLLAGLLAECPPLAARLAGADVSGPPLAIARVPYGFLHRGGAGPFRLGDQMGVIASFTGDGIALALRTAQMAGECFLAGGAPADYHAAARRAIGGPIRLAGALYAAGRIGPMQAAMMEAARFWPGGVRRIAQATRGGAPLPSV